MVKESSGCVVRNASGIGTQSRRRGRSFRTALQNQSGHCVSSEVFR